MTSALVVPSLVLLLFVVYSQFVKSITHNKTITQPAFPDQPLPVLVPLNKGQMEYRRKAGIQESEDGYFCEDAGKMVPVRCVSETLETLNSRAGKIAFEAKYGLTIHDNTLREAFFSLMLAQAVAGQDPDRGVQEALRYYRGDSPPHALFGIDSPVNQGIRQEPFRVLLEMLNAHLKQAHPVIWWSSARNKASLGLYCSDGVTALFALALARMGLPGGLGVCQRCGNPFLRSRRTQHYCSHRCQLAASMRRFRERHARTRDRNKRRKSQGRRVVRRRKP
jgi:hypothetical protein